MKIRAGFVSNSSSTSFLIIAAEALTQESFLELMGVDRRSPLAPMFSSLYDSIMDRHEPPVDLAQIDETVPVREWLEGFRGEVTPRMIEKLKQAKRNGLRVYYGRLSTESSEVESYFCYDSFEVENSKFYFNALECSY